MNQYEMPINWYPGHMAKTRRLLQEQLKRVDLVIEIIDARIPYSSRNPELKKMIAGKKNILLMNKSDLSDPETTRQWIRYYRTAGEDAYSIRACDMQAKEIRSIIDRATRDTVEKYRERGIRKTVRAMVIGVPNVGKSTLINRLRGSSVVQTGDRPGVTKSNQWVRISPYLELMDTPGMLWPRLDDQEAAKRICYIGSVKEDVVDLGFLTISLLEELISRIPETVAERFHLLPEDLSLRGMALIDAVCRGRGWLLKGNCFDYDRCFSIVLDEFRSGKLGKISLEVPAD